MKKRFLTVILTMALMLAFASCEDENKDKTQSDVLPSQTDGVSSQTDSETPSDTSSTPDFDKTVTFNEDSAAAYAYPNVFMLYDDAADYNYAFFDRDNGTTYITAGERLLKTAQDGSVTEEPYALDSFVADGVLYYIDWGGEDGNEKMFCKRQNGTSTLIAPSINHLVYADDAAFYMVDHVLYRYDFSSGETSEVTKLPEKDFYSNVIVYRGEIWIPVEGLVISYTGETLAELGFTWDFTLGARNGYIYYIKDGGFCRIDTKTKQVETLPGIIFDDEGGYPCYVGFTDEYMFYDDGENLYRTDNTFADPQLIKKQDDMYLPNITVNNAIYISNPDGAYQIDMDGNILAAYTESDEPLPVEKIDLTLDNALMVGFWNAMPGVAADYGDNYRFFENGTYRFGYNVMDGMKRTISEFGYWEISDGVLKLKKTAEQVLIGGEIVYDDPVFGDYIDGGTVKTEKITHPKSVDIELTGLGMGNEITFVENGEEMTFRYEDEVFITLMIGEERFWKLNSDPHGEYPDETDEYGDFYGRELSEDDF